MRGEGTGLRDAEAGRGEEAPDGGEVHVAAEERDAHLLGGHKVEQAAHERVALVLVLRRAPCTHPPSAPRRTRIRKRKKGARAHSGRSGHPAARTRRRTC